MGVLDWLFDSPSERRLVQECERLALLAAEQMRDWESRDPDKIGWFQCYEWGRAWLAERGLGNPAMADVILRSGYIAIIQDKIRSKHGLLHGAELLNRIVREEEAIRSDPSYREDPSPVMRYVDTIEWRFDALWQLAAETGALEGATARELYKGRLIRPR